MGELSLHIWTRRAAEEEGRKPLTTDREWAKHGHDVGVEASVITGEFNVSCLKQGAEHKLGCGGVWPKGAAG